MVDENGDDVSMLEPPKPVSPTTIPYRLIRDERGWTAECKFCRVKTEDASYSPSTVQREIKVHARERHLNHTTGLYMNDKDLVRWWVHRRKMRGLMGNYAQVASMNREGL